MLTLPAFQYHDPKTVEEAVALLSQFPGEAKVLAGGTDLLPNMKHRLFTPSHLIALKNIPGLREIRRDGEWIRMGAMCTIAQLAVEPLIVRHLPSLASAASQIAGPQLREMGTLGGNLCLDTRCVYYNQTYFWRRALGFCLKKDGTVCHVVQGGTRCVAAASNDTAPVLMTLDSSVRVVGPSGTRDLPILKLYTSDGIRNTVLRPEELVIEVRVPLPAPSVRMGYQKLRVRAAIDYPALTLAVAAQVDESNRLDWVRVVISSLGARPHFVAQLDQLHGRDWNDALIGDIGRAAQKQCHPLTNINVDAAWRREMIPIFVRRAFALSRSVAQVPGL